MKKLISAVAVALALNAFAGQAAAASGCYTKSEFEAEQGLRIHSELMVIGLTCLKTPGGAGLYSKYQTFTAKHQALITRYENDLISYYRKQGVKNPEKEFHTLRTSLANGISKHAIGNVSGFCRTFSPRIDKALEMDDKKLRAWAQHVWPKNPTRFPVCTKA